MNTPQKRMVNRMTKDRGYHTVVCDIPYATKLVRKAEPNRTIYISEEGIVFKPYWLWR